MVLTWNAGGSLKIKTLKYVTYLQQKTFDNLIMYLRIE
jgi:hypothetical protein